MSLQCTAPDDVVARLRRADRRRLGGACAGLAVAVLVLALLRVVWGTYQVTVPDLVRILGGETIPGASFIVLEEKLPRAVAAVFATARSVGGERFVVAGIAVAAAGQAVVAGAMLSLAQHDLQSATVWIAGSLNGVTWGRIALLAGVLVVALPLAGVLHARLAPADVGPDHAHALGARPRPTSAAALGLGAVLAAVATAVVGPLAFVALLATPVARGLTRGLPSLPAAALTGAALVLLADLVAGEAVPLLTGAALPTGVLTGAAGAPLMLWLLLRQGRTPGGVRSA